MTQSGETTLLLVRHGQTDWNVAGRIQGASDTPLNENGREQARRLAARLSGLAVEAVYSSDLARAAETARIVRGQRHVPLRLTTSLREIRYGEWEGKTRAELEEAGLARTLSRWNDGHAVPEPAGGETREQVDERVDRFLACVVPRHEGHTIIVVSHGGTLRLMLCRLLGLSASQWGQVRQGNTALSKAVLVPGRRPRVVFMNDTAHLRGTRFDRALSGALQTLPRGAEI